VHLREAEQRMVISCCEGLHIYPTSFPEFRVECYREPILVCVGMLVRTTTSNFNSNVEILAKLASEIDWLR